MTEILTKYNNVNHILLFNETILMLESNPSIAFELEVGSPKWIMAVHFVSNNNKSNLNVSYEVKGNKSNSNLLHIYLNKWYSPDWVETKEPLIFTSTDKMVELKVQIRSQCESIFNQRTVTISVWKRQ